MSNGHAFLQGLGAPRRNHTILATVDLTTPFLPIATVTAGADGSFSYEDSNIGNLDKRFYRVGFP